MNTDSHWSKQETCFTCATQVWLSVNHNTSVTSGEWFRCSKHIAQANELGSCQSNLCHSWGYEWLQKSNDLLKACFENVNIGSWTSHFTKNSKWVWGSGNTPITNRRQPCGIARKSRSTITRHQEDKLSKATSSLFPIKMIAILERTQSNVQQNI